MPPKLPTKNLTRRLYRGFMRPVLASLPRDRSCRDVLLLCQNGLMAEYLQPVWQAVRDDPRLRFHLAIPRDRRTDHERDRIRELLPVREVPLRWAYVRPWDLIVTADHGHHELANRRRCPTIFTSHGMIGKVVDGEPEGYVYGPRSRDEHGEPRYSCMFEASDVNRQRAIARHAGYADVVRVIGSPHDDALLRQLGRRDEIRAELGFGHSDNVVFVIGSWGPESLFHTAGDALIENAHALLGDYSFVLSVHPHEYRPQPNGGRVWGQHLRTLIPQGFRVREPSESWIPYLVASDLILTDHTALAVYAGLARKPMMFVPVPDHVVEPSSVIWKLREFCPELRDMSNLGTALHDALRDFPHDRMRELSLEINSRPMESAVLMRQAFYDQLDLRRRAAG